MVIRDILTAVVGYLIGCISFGYLTGKIFKGKDIREVGSGNAGTANAIRNYGWAIGLITFAGDVLKGAAAALIGMAICGAEIGIYIGGIAVVLGHIWPVFLKFRGGKGVATSLGVFLVMMPLQAAVVFAVCIIIIALTKTMSLGSLIGTVLMVVCSFVFYFGVIGNHITSVLLLILVLYSHRQNIKRLAEGKENQL